MAGQTVIETERDPCYSPEQLISLYTNVLTGGHATPNEIECNNLGMQLAFSINDDTKCSSLLEGFESTTCEIDEKDRDECLDVGDSHSTQILVDSTVVVRSLPNIMVCTFTEMVLRP